MNNPDRNPLSARPPGISSASCKLLEIENRIFTESNLQAYGFAVAWAWALFTGWLLLVGDKLRAIDFCWIWVSGNLANSSNPALVYDPIAFTAAQITLL